MVFDLLITRSGDYWVATSAGVARFNPLAYNSESKFKTYVPTGRPDAEVITDLYEDSSRNDLGWHRQWLSQAASNGDDWQLEYVSLGENQASSLDVTTIVEASPGVLWIGAEAGTLPSV